MPLFPETDDGFVGYVEKSHDPGNSLIFATILFCIIIYCSLPFLVSLGFRLEIKNQINQEKRQRWKAQPRPPSTRSSNNNNNNVPIIATSEYDGSVDPIFEATEGPPSPMSVVSGRSAISVTPSVSSLVSLHSQRSRKRRRRKRHNKRIMEKKNEWVEFELRMQRYDAYADSVINGTDDAATNKAEENAIVKLSDSPTRRPKSRDQSPVRSVMGSLDQDALSFGDAVSITTSSPARKGYPPPLRDHLKTNQPDDVNPADDDTSFWNSLLDLAVWDFESKRIIKLAIPFAIQSLSTGILDIITAAVIGKVLGTSEISAFVTVRGLIHVSSSFFGGYHESIAVLCSQAMGKNNVKLVGHYVQLSMILYVVSYIPFVILWWVSMPSILEWLGFDQDTVDIGQGYTQVYLFLELLDGVEESVHGLLDVIDLESYSTLIGVSQEVITFLDILAATFIAKPSLYVIGLIELFVAIVFLIVNVGIIIWRGWFRPYREGLIGSCALYNKTAVKLMLSTSCSLSIGYLLTDGEWEILTLFAKYMGPAE
ncbi:Mate efflux family protein (Partial), partial [Seminavis robusta]|eukprot:Sro2383_g325670.1 Mate efflux family protein (538) ;mRNA; f:13496-15189